MVHEVQERGADRRKADRREPRKLEPHPHGVKVTPLTVEEPPEGDCYCEPGGGYTPLYAGDDAESLEVIGVDGHAAGAKGCIARPTVRLADDATYCPDCGRALIAEGALLACPSLRTAPAQTVTLPKGANIIACGGWS